MLGAVSIAYAVFFFTSKLPHPGIYTLVPTLGAASIILFANEKTLVGKFLATKPLVGIGLISYSAHLWHWPIFVFFRHRSLNEPTHLQFAGLSLLALLLGYLSWKYIERPFRDPRRFGMKSVFGGSAIAAPMFTVFDAAVLFQDGFERRFSPEILSFVGKDAPARKNPRQAECNTGGIDYRSPSASCVLEDPRRVVGALWGDSHADALSHALSTSLSGTGMGIRQMT